MNCCYILIIFWVYLCVTFEQLSSLRQPFQREKSNVVEMEFNSTSDYIKHYGYKAEQYEFRSSDGFWLSVFRIRGGGSPILLQHDLFLASDSWVLQGKKYDLAFLLADKGHDIWIADNRGNTFSRSHVELSPAKFWNFSFSEMGSYDMPSVIDYILRVTEKKKVDIIGHSFGAISAFIMCSSQPEYNYKVRSLIAIAPAVFFNKSIRSKVRRILKRYYSNIKKPAIVHARAILGLRGVSYKTLVHLTQLIRKGKLINFDYGTKGNIVVYKSEKPPEFNLTLVTVPVTLLFSDGDVHVSSQDIKLLKLKLPNVAATLHIDKPTFNHMDFIWGPQANETNEFILKHFIGLDSKNSKFKECKNCKLNRQT